MTTIPVPIHERSWLVNGLVSIPRRCSNHNGQKITKMDPLYDDNKPLMVHVTAPASLPAGYTFEALINDDPDRPFTCEVVCQEQSSV